VLLAGVLTVVVTGLLTCVAGLLRIRRWYLWALAGPLVSAALVFGYIRWASDPNRDFENEFGFPVSPPVVVYHAHSQALGDSGEAFFHFHANPATVQQIVAGWSEGGEPMSTNVEPPGWWQPRLSGTRQYFQPFSHGSSAAATSPAPKRFSSEDRWLIYDPQTGDVWYRFVGID
jgi:hypothetical protein